MHNKTTLILGSQRTRHRISVYIALFTIVISLCVLTGWIFNIPVFKSLSTGFVSMKINTALGFLFCGVSLWLLIKENKQKYNIIVRISSVIVVLIGGLSIVQYLFGINLGIDELFIKDTTANIRTSHPGRMSVLTALNFMLLGTTFFIESLSILKNAKQIMPVVVLTISGFALAGYILGLQELFTMGPYTAIALHTSITFLLISLGYLLTCNVFNRAFIIKAGFALALTIQILVGGVPYWNIVALEDDFQWTEHTGQVNKFIARFNAALKDMHLLELNYLLTATKPDTIKLHKLHNVIDNDLNSLILLTSDNRQQQERLNKLNDLVAKDINRIKNIITMGKEEYNAETLVKFKTSQSYFSEEIKSLIQTIADEENRLLQTRIKKSEISTEHTKGTIIFGSIVSVILLILVLTFLVLERNKRDKAEEVVRKSEEKFRNVFENSPIGKSLTTLEGRMNGNKALADILGYNIEELSQLNPEDLIFSDDLGNIQKITDSLLKGHLQETRYQVRYIHKNGNKIWADVSDFLQRDEKGKPLFFITSVIDITKQKIAEETLKEKTAELDRFFSHSLDLLCIADLNGYFLRLNKSWETTLGYRQEELIGRPFLDYVHPDDIQATIDAMADLTKGIEVTKFTNRYRCRDGTYKWIEWLSAPAGNFIYAAARDITERKNINEDLKKLNEELDNASRAKSDFLANMSHEIRTPINAIIGLNRLLHNTGLNEKQKDYITKIHMASQSLLSIINDILDFSKIEAGKLDIESVTFNINDILNNLANLVSMKAQEKQLEIIYDMDKSLPALLRGDPIRLQQILLNLTTNAIKFTESGHIIVSLKVIKKQRNKILIRFSVKDTGIGISPQDMDKLFQTYSQVDASTSRRFGGSGLGLSISKKLVEMMDGEIGVKSIPGRGSTFFFTIPFAYREKEENDFLQPPVDLKGLRVLVVDDVKDIRDVILDQLQMFTFQAVAVPSAAKAIAELRNALASGSKYYDLVIMDWKINGTNGIEASRRIKNDPEIAHKPKIILISAYQAKETMSHEDMSYIDAFMSKPFSLSRLFNTILNVFGKEVQEKYLTNGFITKAPAGFNKIKGARILLVEDNEINRQVAQETLENEGFWVTTAIDGFEAVKKVKASLKDDGFDVVLMDLQMPGMDGFQATREIRREPVLNDLPIIAMTADVVGSVRQRCFEAGMNDYVSKPIEPFELYSALVKWIKPGERELYQVQSDDIRFSGFTSDTFTSILSCFNVKDGLQRVNQNQALYKKLLLKFKTNYSTFKEEIKQAIKRKDSELAIRLAHTLKGVAGNLGAEALFKAARNLETALSENNNQQIDKNLTYTNDALNKALKAVQKFEEVTESMDNQNNQPALSFDEIIRELTAAKSLLNESDAAAIKKIENLQPSLISWGYKDELKAIMDRLAAYDFEKALFIVQKVIASMDQKEG